MFGFRDYFDYFQCANCNCMQIEHFPGNIDKYYPDNYYSYKNSPIPKFGLFKKLQFNYLTGENKNILGKIACFKYKPPKYYDWLRNLELKDRQTRILDIGCGNGEVLKILYSFNFTFLRGIDPYINENIEIDDKLKMLKKSVYEVGENYDIVMMHHSLEHMTDQLEVLEKVFEILSPTGQFLLRIPIISETLMAKYGANVVSLDPPRHFYIHSLKSIEMLLKKVGFKIKKKIFDTEVFDIIASEQYVKNIAINEKGSYVSDKKNGLFSKKEINTFKQLINKLNDEEQGSSIALYLTK